MPTEDMSWKKMLASRFSSALIEEWFSSYEFLAGIYISNIKYRYLGSKHNSSFYSFNDQLEFALAYYFAESETTKSNKNKFLSAPLIEPLTKKLFNKNANKWIKKLAEIP